MILVTKPFSPPFNEYSKILEGVWERNYFTNNGPLIIEQVCSVILKTLNKTID